MVIIPLLGVTWLFGLLTPLHKAFNYVFTILNSTQVRIFSNDFVDENIHIKCPEIIYS